MMGMGTSSCSRSDCGVQIGSPLGCVTARCAGVQLGVCPRPPSVTAATQDKGQFSASLQGFL